MATPTAITRRIDRAGAPLRRAHVRESDGAHLYEGIASREGVLIYQTPNGPRRELVTLDALKSMAGSLPRATLTLTHPAAFVSPDNVGKHGVGDVDGEMVIEEEDTQGAFARVRVAVRRRDAIDSIARGTHELSVGYDATLDETPGTHPVFGPYDARQIGRVVNHLAVVDRGRAGASVALRTDALESSPPTPQAGGSMTPEQIQALATALAPMIAGAVATEVIKKLAEAENAESAALDAKNAAPAAAPAAQADMVPTAEMKAKMDAKDAEIAALRTRVDAADLAEVDRLIGLHGIKTDAKDLTGKRAAVASHAARRTVDAADPLVPGLLAAAAATVPSATGDRYAGSPAAPRTDGADKPPAPKSIREAREAARTGGAQ
jgi:hypothetical protein